MSITAVVGSAPEGFCECGCGQPAPVATSDNRRYGWKRGVPVRFVSGHNAKLYSKIYGTRGYPGASRGDGTVEAIHRLRAERALGKPLPKGAAVHHADGSKAIDAPLVICQDARYHNLLHARMRVVKAGGNPNSQRICGRCRQLKVFSEFNRFRHASLGLSHYCRECMHRMKRVYAAARKGMA